MKKIIVSTLMLSAVSLAYTMTNQESKFSKQAIKALEKKDYKSYYYLKSKL